MTDEKLDPCECDKYPTLIRACVSIKNLDKSRWFIECCSRCSSEKRRFDTEKELKEYLTKPEGKQ